MLCRRIESCRAAKDSSVIYRKTECYSVRFVAIRRSTFRNVRPVLLNELRVFNWMTICAVREFLEDENRDRLSHDLRKIRIQAQLRLLRLKLDRRVWLRVRNLEKIVVQNLVRIVRDV